MIRRTVRPIFNRTAVQLVIICEITYMDGQIRPICPPDVFCAACVASTMTVIPCVELMSNYYLFGINIWSGNQPTMAHAVKRIGLDHTAKSCTKDVDYQNGWTRFRHCSGRVPKSAVDSGDATHYRRDGMDAELFLHYPQSISGPHVWCLANSSI